METKLLPCPFCGGCAVNARFRDDNGVLHESGNAQCDDVDCPGFDTICDPEDWNRRAPTEREARFEKALREIANWDMIGASRSNIPIGVHGQNMIDFARRALESHHPIQKGSDKP